MLTKEQYLQMKATWASKQYHSAADHTIYNILRKKDPQLGFTPITNPRKINSNGDDPLFAFKKAKRAAYYSITLSLYSEPCTERLSFYARRNNTSLDEARQYFYGQWEKEMQNTKDQFKKTFGLELTPELSCEIKELLK